jgi:2-methylaconitate cis-trans-isomerase PrpF
LAVSRAPAAGRHRRPRLRAAGSDGSPDLRQIAGLGGDDPLTSKVAIASNPHFSDGSLTNADLYLMAATTII